MKFSSVIFLTAASLAQSTTATHAETSTVTATATATATPNAVSYSGPSYAIGLLSVAIALL